MKQYLDTLRLVLEQGEERMDRTGTGTISLFAPPQMVFDLQEGFPLVTTKKMFLKGVIEELLWFLRGDTNVRHLQEKGVHIWDKNYEAYRKDLEFSADVNCEKLDHEDGDLGPIYGHQWRHWDCAAIYHSQEDGTFQSMASNYIDQISTLVSMIKHNQTSRRLLVSAWNVGQIEDMALPPCHVMFQCYVRKGEYLDMQMYQRSADMFLGVPFNIASYALLLCMLAQETELQAGRLTMTLGDAHIYKNHIEQVKEQLNREPYPLPHWGLKKPVDNGEMEFESDCLILENYQCHPTIKAEMSA